jgi:hypothetical protein
MANSDSQSEENSEASPPEDEAKQEPASLILVEKKARGPSMARPAKIFISYSHVDEPHRKQLDVHLTPLKREGLIDTWHDRMLTPGTDWSHEINRNLAEADIVLLLVSADFVASDYCFDKEMGVALDRHSRGEACVIPVFVRPTDFGTMPFARFQGLPRDAKPVSLWLSADEAWLDVAKGIRRAVESLGAKPVLSTSAGPAAGSISHSAMGMPQGGPISATSPEAAFWAAEIGTRIQEHIEAAFEQGDKAALERGPLLQISTPARKYEGYVRFARHDRNMGRIVVDPNSREALRVETEAGVENVPMTAVNGVRVLVPEVEVEGGAPATPGPRSDRYRGSRGPRFR